MFGLVTIDKDSLTYSLTHSLTHSLTGLVCMSGPEVVLLIHVKAATYFNEKC